MIDVRNLEKSFGDHKVLDGINEHIYPGEKVVVIGTFRFRENQPLLRCPESVGAADRQETITVDGVDITDPKDRY